MIKQLGKESYSQFWHDHNGSPLQSWSWGEFKSSTWKVERIGVFDNDRLMSVATIFKRKIPIISKKFAYIPRGVIVDSPESINLVLREIGEYLKNEKIAFVLLDPDNNLFEKDWNEHFSDNLEANGWRKSGITIQPNQTNIIDISAEENEIFQNFRPKWRRNVNKSERQGVHVELAKDKEDVKKFYKCLEAVSQKGTFSIHKLDYFQRMYETLGEDVKIFNAVYEGEAVASYLVLLSNKVACEIYGGVTDKGRDTEASYFLKWEIVKNLKEKGILYYDQWGVAPKGDENHPLSGISYFKSGFGGNYVQFLPQYAKVFDPLIFAIFQMLKKYLLKL